MLQIPSIVSKITDLIKVILQKLDFFRHNPINVSNNRLKIFENIWVESHFSMTVIC